MVNMTTKGGLYLTIAIICEVLGTIALKKAEGFSKLYPSLFVIAGYSFAFYFLSQSLKYKAPLGISYAIWSGLGTAIIAIAGVFFFKESLNWPSILGIIMIITGVVILSFYSEVH